jgi:cellulose synthase/poly-beta-1,6-N-acetylglucosamine synthase-like glycosyltransferase
MLLQAKQKHNITFLKDKAAIVYTKGTANLKTFFYQRIRWASKSSGYKDSVALLTALSVFFLNLLILTCFGLGFFCSYFFILALGLFFLKMAVDFPIFYGVSGFFRMRKLMRYYVLMEIFYTIYVIVTATLSWLIPFEWKNRNMKK